MSLLDGGPAITVPGVCHNLALDIAEAHSLTAYVLGPLGQQPEAELVVGETLTHGVIRLSSADPRFYEAIAVAAAQCAAFIRDSQIRSVA